MSLKIDIEKHGTEGEIILNGRLDVNSSGEAGGVFAEMAERFDDLVVDMKDLEYISSAGLRILLRTFTAMSDKNGTFKLKNVDRSVMEVLEITGFAGIYTFI